MNGKPNILLIMPDQMRGDCIGLAGHPTLLTPNMDEIGGQGACFRRAYTTCASCIAARRSLLTGQFPATNGMVGYQEGQPLRSPVLPQVLADAGYHTAIAGRHMHQAPYDAPYGYQTRVFASTYIEGDEYGAAVEKQVQGSGGIKGHGMSFNGWTAKPWHLPEHLHPTNWTVLQSRRILREHEESRPLFLTTSFYAPHPPLIPPAFYMDRYLRMNAPAPAIGSWETPPPGNGVGVGIDANRTVLAGEALRTAQAGYFGLINHIDDQIYWLIREFQSLSWGMKRPWVIVLTSDHGEMLGDHYLFRKCEPYEGSSRIPLLIWASPELGLKPGLTCDQPACLEDLMPTLLDLAGLEPPGPVDGRSLVPVLRGEDVRVRECLHGEHAPCYDEEQAYHFMTDGRLKYIWRPASGREQLFDLRQDPTELRDLNSSHQRRRELEMWRLLLIERLGGRPEGFTDGKVLIPGRPYHAVLGAT